MSWTARRNSTGWTCRSRGGRCRPRCSSRRPSPLILGTAPHWLKKRFFDRPHPDVFTMTSTYRDNEFLDESDIRVFEEMRQRRPRQYEVAGLGEWGTAEGLVFDRWRRQDFDLDRLPGRGDSPEDEAFVHVFGLDYGYTNDPTAFIAAAVNPGRRCCISTTSTIRNGCSTVRSRR